VIDTHCHLSHPDFEPDRDEVIARSWRDGVTAMSVLVRNRWP